MRKLIVYLTLLYLLSACNLQDETTPSFAETNERSPSPSTIQMPHQSENIATPIAITGTVYYIGQGDCSDSGEGTVQTPFCTFTSALNQLQPGDALTIKPGQYQEQLVIQGISGESDAPIIIQAQDGVVFDGGCPAFPCGVNDVSWEGDEETGLITIAESNHLALRGWTIQNVIAAGISIVNSNHIHIENMTIAETGNAGLLARHATHLTITRNDIGQVQLGWRDERGNPQIGAHEALSLVAVTDFAVSYNNVHDILKEGIDVKEGSTRGTVDHNVVERTCAVGIYINEAEQVQVHHNQIRASGYFLSADGEERLCEHYPEYGRFFDQYYGTGILLAVGDLGELSQGYLAQIDVHHNVIWNVHGNGIEFWDEWRESGSGQGEMADNRIFNNTIHQTGLSGIRLQDVTNTEVTNNILSLNDEDAITGNAIEDNSISHNLFHFAHDWQEAKGSNYLVGDPLFIDSSIGNFHLQVDSMAVDAGIDMGHPITGSAPDIGSFEQER